MNHDADHRPVNVTDDEQSTLTTMQARQGATPHVTHYVLSWGWRWSRWPLSWSIGSCALAGFVSDGLFVGCLEIVDVQHFAGSSGLGKTRQQGLFLLQRHVLALASAAWSRLECLDATVVIGHVRPVHRAQRYAHCRGNQRLRHPALAQQHHLDALTLLGRYFPSQCCFQPPDLASGAFDHLFPPN